MGMKEKKKGNPPLRKEKRKPTKHGCQITAQVWYTYVCLSMTAAVPRSAEIEDHHEEYRAPSAARRHTAVLFFRASHFLLRKAGVVCRRGSRTFYHVDVDV